jgi:hypothetical protein
VGIQQSEDTDARMLACCDDSAVSL